MMTDEPRPPATALPLEANSMGPLGDLPRLTRVEAQLLARFGLGGPPRVGELADALGALIGGPLVVDRCELIPRAAGLKRPGVVVHLAWPRLGTRLALGIDPPLAHALVDALLGYERTAAEAKLQVSPVEWGILGFVAASGLDRLEAQPGPFGPWDLTIDRVGPDSFDLTGLGPVLTYRWRVVVGATTGTARLWLPESLALAAANVSKPPAPARSDRRPLGALWARFSDLVSEWRVEAGRVTLEAAEVGDLVAPGRILLLDGGPLGGTVASPLGPVTLVQLGRAGRSTYAARVEPGSSGDRVVLTSILHHEPTPRRPPMATIEPTSPVAADDPAGTPDGVTVTLTVELGRISLPLAQLAELQPGAVLELARHGREPVDLTSNGRLVARGELIQIDTELGVRVTQVFF